LTYRATLQSLLEKEKTFTARFDSFERSRLIEVRGYELKYWIVKLRDIKTRDMNVQIRQIRGKISRNDFPAFILSRNDVIQFDA
jgi:hypothetical protein